MTSVPLPQLGNGAVTGAAVPPLYPLLKRRVAQYLQDQRRPVRDDPRMYLKTAFLFAWAGGSYTALVFAATTWWAAGGLAVSLGLAVAGIGFAVQHDAAHGAYSNSRALNRLLALSLDLIGGSSYLWKIKHNKLHHSHTNEAGLDDDLDIGVFGRLSPDQPLYRAHRFQHVYLWALYGLLAPKWHLFDDFHRLATGTFGGARFPRPRSRELAVLIAGKVVFFTLAFVIPLSFHPWWAVLACYGVMAYTLGLVLSLVFQLAHCVVEAWTGSTAPAGDWARRQIETTSDFACDNGLLTAYVGGLNMQVEHHLFATVCHLRYPEIVRIVRQTCLENGVRYHAHPSVWSALKSHYRFLRALGREARPEFAASTVPRGRVRVEAS